MYSMPSHTVRCVYTLRTPYVNISLANLVCYFVLSCRFVMGGGQWVPSRRVWGAPRYLDYTDFNTQNLEKPEFSQILKGGGGV